MEQKDLDIIRKFEKAKTKQGLRTIGILFLLALICCPIYILLDVIENGTVEVTFSYFKKFFLGFCISFMIYFLSYYDIL